VEINSGSGTLELMRSVILEIGPQEVLRRISNAGGDVEKWASIWVSTVGAEAAFHTAGVSYKPVTDDYFAVVELLDATHDLTALPAIAALQVLETCAAGDEGAQLVAQAVEACGEHVEQVEWDAGCPGSAQAISAWKIGGQYLLVGELGVFEVLTELSDVLEFLDRYRGTKSGNSKIEYKGSLELVRYAMLKNGPEEVLRRISERGGDIEGWTRIWVEAVGVEKALKTAGVAQKAPNESEAIDELKNATGGLSRLPAPAALQLLETCAKDDAGGPLLLAEIIRAFGNRVAEFDADYPGSSRAVSAWHFAGLYILIEKLGVFEILSHLSHVREVLARYENAKSENSYEPE
jgi:hypothetical protein